MQMNIYWPTFEAPLRRQQQFVYNLPSNDNSPLINQYCNNS